MMLIDLRNRVYTHCRDFGKDKFDPLLVDALLNEALEEFNSDTGLLRVRSQVTITSGIGDLVDSGDRATAIQGTIMRVEDSGNNNKKLARTSEEKMDVLKGAAWRLDTVGPMQFWMRGKSNEGSQTGYETIIVYPLVSSGTVNVFHIKRPTPLITDTDTPEIPTHYHMALVWHCLRSLLLDSSDQQDTARAEHSSKRYEEFLMRAKDEALRELR